MKRLDFMILDMVLRHRLGLAAAAATFLSVAGFSGATPALAEEDSNMFNSVLGFVGMQDKQQELDRLPGQAADRRSAAHRSAAAERGGTRPSLAKRSRYCRRAPRGVGFANARAAVDAKFAGRNVSAAVGWPPRRVRGARRDAALPLYALEISEVHRDRLSLGYRPAGTGAAAQISDRAPCGLQTGDRGRQGNHRNAGSAERPAGRRRSGSLYPVAGSQNLGRQLTLRP